MKKTLFLSLLLIFSCSKDKDCNPGFTGPDCDQELTPEYIKLKSLELLKFPPTDNGAGWDIFDGPDIYFELIYNGNSIYDSKGLILNNHNSTPVFLPLLENVNFDHPADRYTFRLWDYDDTSADDFMGAIEFTPYSQGSGFPDTGTLSCTGCNTSWKLYLEYVH